MGSARDRLLGPLYWLRRYLLLRTGRFPLTETGEGWYRVDVARATLPHGPIRLRLAGQGEWASVELRGLGGPDEPRSGWRLWRERPLPGQELTLELPFGLRELSLKLHGAEAAPRSVELAELRPPERMASRSSRAPTAAEVSTPSGDYPAWVDAFECPSATSRQRLAERARQTGLRGAVLLLAGSPDPGSGEAAPALPEGVPLIRRLEEGDADFVVTVPRGARLAAHGLDALACAFGDHPEALVVHADDDLVGPDGRRSAPSFKPSFSPELLRARNYLDGLVAFRRSALPADRRGPLDRASRYGLLLELSARESERGVHRLPAVLLSLSRREPDGAGERRVLTEHMRVHGISAEILDGEGTGSRRLRYGLPDSPPTVSIIVPTRNAGRLVETCVRSVHRFTDYPKFELVLVDNGSDDAESLSTFAALAAEGLVRLTRDPSPFNFAALNNRAVAAASSDLVCLMNNDVEALHAGWLSEMVGVALQPGVGAVGAKLLFPDGRIQHAGVLVGYQGVADHLYAGAPGDAGGLDGHLRVRRDVSAVTAACLVIRRNLYREVGGLDEQAFPVGYNDVDLCLRLRERGFRNVWTPHARLVHRESATRGRRLTPDQLARVASETEELQERWHTQQLEDPYHSPNLSNDSVLPALAFPPRRHPWAVGCGS